MQLLINHQFILLLTECNGTGLMTSHCQVFYEVRNKNQIIELSAEAVIRTSHVIQNKCS